MKFFGIGKKSKQSKTFWVFCMPFLRIDRIVAENIVIRGGVIESVFYQYRFLNTKIYKTRVMLEIKRLFSYELIDYDNTMAQHLKKSNSITYFQDLCRGLDTHSVQLVSKIIARMQYCYNNSSNYFDKPLTKTEMIELERINTEFYSNIVTLKKQNQEVYFWNGYFLPIHYFIPSVFLA